MLSFVHLYFHVDVLYTDISMLPLLLFHFTNEEESMPNEETFSKHSVAIVCR